MEAQRHRGFRARNEVRETRESLAQAEQVVERLRQEAAFAAASAPPPAQAPAGTWVDWHRQLVATKVWLVAAQAVSKEVAQEVLGKQCEFAGIRSDHFELRPGGELAQSFVVGFVGEPRLAARRAAMRLGTMKAADGAWPQTHANTLAGESVRVWLDLDKSGKQLKGEAELRRLFRALRVVAPTEKRRFVDTAALTITGNWPPLAGVVMGEPTEDARVEWNPVTTASFGLTRAVAEAELARTGGSRGEAVEWCP